MTAQMMWLVKHSPMLNYATRHEDVGVNGDTSPGGLNLATRWM